ncbi:MAG: DUF7112 family protein [Halanaeroarchaeum sp.]
MPDRVPHDHPTVETIDGTLGRYGGTRRPEIRLPETDDIPTGDVVRLVLDGTEYRTKIERQTDGSPVLRGAYETPRLARNPGSATDALQPWVDERELDFGRTVHLDVVDSGYRYGLRAPGESATYATTETPDDSLASIARDLDGS